MASLLGKFALLPIDRACYGVSTFAQALRGLRSKVPMVAPNGEQFWLKTRVGPYKKKVIPQKGTKEYKDYEKKLKEQAKDIEKKRKEQEKQVRPPSSLTCHLTIPTMPICCW
jgi:hypothetical protein